MLMNNLPLNSNQHDNDSSRDIPALFALDNVDKDKNWWRIYKDDLSQGH